VEELLDDPAAARLDAVVLACDPSRPEGLTAVRKLAKHLDGSRVIVVSPATLGAGVRSALGAGACAFVAEAQLEATLALATRSALAGQVSLPRQLHRCAIRPAFSHREKQVLALVVRGLGNRQIALRLFLSESTVKSHLASAFQKLGVRSRKEAAAVLLDPDEGLGESILSVALDQAS
jgi:DNA-binding NarL/FixJ family response regulator